MNSTWSDLLTRLQRRFPRHSLRGRLAGGTFWVTVGSVLARLSSLLVGIIVARMLGEVKYGELGVVLTSLSMFSAYASLRLGLVASRYVAAYRTSDPQRAARVLGLSAGTAIVSGGAVAAAVVIIAPWLAATVLQAPQLANMLRVSAIGMFFAALNGSQVGALTGLEAFRSSALVETIRGILSLPVIMALSFLWGLPGAVWGYTIMLVAGWAITHLALRHAAKPFGIRFAFKGSLRELPILWRFGLPSFLAGLMLWPMQWLGCAIVINAIPTTAYAELGTYQAAKQWWAMLLFLPQMLAQVTVPIFTERYTSGDSRAVRKILFAGVGVVSLLTVPVAVGVSLLSGFVMSLYGPAFADGGAVLTIIVWAAVLCSLQQPISQVMVASSRMWVHFSTAIGLSGGFLLTTYLLRSQGAMALAWGSLVGYGLQSALMFAAAWMIGRRDMNAAAAAAKTAVGAAKDYRDDEPGPVEQA